MGAEVLRGAIILSDTVSYIGWVASAGPPIAATLTDYEMVCCYPATSIAQGERHVHGNQVKTRSSIQYLTSLAAR
jgi:hypothetical protein